MTSVSDRLRQAVYAGVITQDESQRIGMAFDVEHDGAVISVHLERLTDDEREALDRVCVWIEREIANADHD